MLDAAKNFVVVTASAFTSANDTKMPAVNVVTHSSKSTSVTCPTADEIYIQQLQLQYRQEDAFDEFEDDTLIVTGDDNLDTLEMDDINGIAMGK